MPLSEHPILMVTRMVTDNLTDQEFLALYRVAQLNMEPKQRTWYSKISELFTEEDGTRVTLDVKRALDSIFHERFPQKEVQHATE